MKGKETKVCFVVTDSESPSTRWFLYAGRALGAKISTFYALGEGAHSDCDVYVLERETWRFPFQRLGRARVLAWLDDAYHLMPSIAHNVRYWQDMLPMFRRCLRKCDGVIAPNPHLLADYAEYVPEAYLIPNYHNFPKLPDDIERKKDLIGWGGSWAHWPSWRDTGLHLYLPKEYAVQICGSKPVWYMAQMYHPNVEFVADQHMPGYLKTQATWNAALIPVSGEYDKRRSWVKAVEAAYSGTPWCAVGDVADLLYGNCQGGVTYPDPTRLESFLGKEIPSGQSWAESLRITNHLDEWWAALRG